MTRSDAEFFKYMILEQPLSHSYFFGFTYPAFEELTTAKIRWMDFIDAMKNGMEDTFLVQLEDESYLLSEKERVFKDICKTFKGFEHYCKIVNKNTRILCREMIEKHPTFGGQIRPKGINPQDKEGTRLAIKKATEEARVRSDAIRNGDRKIIEQEISRAMEQCPAVPGLFSFQVFFGAMMDSNGKKKVSRKITSELPLGWSLRYRTIKKENFQPESTLADETFVPPPELKSAFDDLRYLVSCWIAAASRRLSSGRDFIERPLDDKGMESVAETKLAQMHSLNAEVERKKREIAMIDVWTNNPTITKLIEEKCLSICRTELRITNFFTIDIWNNICADTYNYQSFCDLGYIKTKQGNNLKTETLRKTLDRNKFLKS